MQMSLYVQDKDAAWFSKWVASGPKPNTSAAIVAAVRECYCKEAPPTAPEGDGAEAESAYLAGWLQGEKAKGEPLAELLLRRRDEGDVWRPKAREWWLADNLCYETRSYVFGGEIRRGCEPSNKDYEWLDVIRAFPGVVSAFLGNRYTVDELMASVEYLTPWGATLNLSLRRVVCDSQHCRNRGIHRHEAGDYAAGLDSKGEPISYSIWLCDDCQHSYERFGAVCCCSECGKPRRLEKTVEEGDDTWVCDNPECVCFRGRGNPEPEGD